MGFSKKYKKMMKKYKRIFKKHGKLVLPWDWAFGFDPFIDFLHFMKDYYELGENVHAIDSPGKSRLETLKEALYWYDKWQNGDDDFFKYAHDEKELKHYQRLGYTVQGEPEKIVADGERYKTVVLTKYKSYRDTVEEWNKKYHEYKHNFFVCVEENLEEWWD